MKTQRKTDKFTMEIMKGRDDKRPLVSLLMQYYMQCESFVIELKKLTLVIFITE